MNVPGELWDHPDPFVLHTQVDPSDIDGLDHTNNTVYVKWCEQAAWAHSGALGLDLDTYRRLDRAMAITRATTTTTITASTRGTTMTNATTITRATASIDTNTNTRD